MAFNCADISVVIPTYDRTDLLAETIRSVLAQTRRPREILVIDNGIENRAAGAVAQFGDAVTLIREQPLGKQVARNTGLKAACSAWVATLDDDDLFHPSFLETAERAIRDGRADIIGSDHRKFRGDHSDESTNFELAPEGYWQDIQRPTDGSSWSFVGKFPLERLLRRVPFYPSSTVIRRDFALAIGGYDPRMRGIMAEDLEFLIRALAAGEAAIIWEALVDYRLHAGNDTASITGQAIGRWRIFEFVKRHHSNLPASFDRALAENLPLRRAQIFDTAFKIKDHDLMRETGMMLRRQEWTLKRHAKKLIAALPPPLSDALHAALVR